MFDVELASRGEQLFEVRQALLLLFRLAVFQNFAIARFAEDQPDNFLDRSVNRFTQTVHERDELRYRQS